MFQILSEAKQHDMTQRFRRIADSIYVEAKRSAIGGIAHIPVWMYGLMLALGWNEIYAVVSSPLYFLFLVLCAVLAYIVYSLNLWGPIYRVGNAMVEQGVEVGKVYLPLNHWWRTGANNCNRRGLETSSRMGGPAEALPLADSHQTRMTSLQWSGWIPRESGLPKTKIRESGNERLLTGSMVG